MGAILAAFLLNGAFTKHKPSAALLMPYNPNVHVSFWHDVIHYITDLKKIIIDLSAAIYFMYPALPIAA